MAAGSDRKRRCCPYTAGAVSDLRSSLTPPKKCRATPATLLGRPLRPRFANGSLAWREFPPPSAARGSGKYMLNRLLDVQPVGGSRIDQHMRQRTDNRPKNRCIPPSKGLWAEAD